MGEETMEMDVRFSPVVVAPTFNNAMTLGGILARIEAVGLPMLIVDDGCTDESPRILADFAAGGRWVDVRVVRHARNRGKAAALRTGFAAASEAGYTHALTIDTDGQLDPEQIPQLIEMARREPTALILGNRSDNAQDYPARSRLGRRLSNHLLRIESGCRVSDSQCGMRVYPLQLVSTVKCRAQRFGYETEIIARAGWAGCPIRQAPVACRYLPVGQRVSHFKPIYDSVRALVMHGRLLVRALAPWPHRQWPGGSAPVLRIKDAISWVSPREAWRQLKQDDTGRTMFATGLALGVFIANLPIYPLQTLAALYAARKLHLHPVSVIAGTQASIPPVNLVMIGAAIYVGQLLLQGSPPAWPDKEITFAMVLSEAPRLLLAWSMGSILVGMVLALATFLVAIASFRVIFRSRLQEIHVEPKALVAGLVVKKAA